MKTSRYALCHLLAVTTLILAFGSASPAADPWITFEGSDGPAKGKHVVLISGDEEYRSEETLPQLAKILAKHHGFKCTVLFAIDPKDGTINPNRRDNIPGLEALKTADLMVIFTRFRDLPDAQMKYIADYVESGRPIIGLRTATHAFDIKGDKTYASTPGTARRGTAASVVKCWAKPGSIITASMVSKAPEASSSGGCSGIQSCAAYARETSGCQPMSTTCSYPCRPTSSRSSSDRCWTACDPTPPCTG